jgi:transglutaminase-like putative cysteine protease
VKASGWRQRLRDLPRDKADTVLLLCSSVMVLAPHALHLPLWTTLVAATALLWRAAITVRGRRLPPIAVLMPVSLVAMGGVYLSFNTLLGRDAGVAMLTLLLAFKLLEMHAKRDLFVVIFLSFFLLLTDFFYSQSIATALLMIATIVVLLTAQLSFQYTGALPPLRRRARVVAGMFAVAAPLALLLFVAFPRIAGPLWGMPGDAHGGRTGLSDSMAPGSLSNLAQSDDVAFRVRFIDAAPAHRRLYWRGIVLGNYDGRTWTRNYASQPAAPADAAPVNIELAGTPLRYQVTLEPNGMRWLFALDLVERLRRMDSNPTVVSPELELIARRPLNERLRYDVSSVLDYHFQADANPNQLRQWLALPAGYNPRTLAWARTVMRAGDPGAGIAAVLKVFHDAPFRYTLEPPLLGRDAVDDFLFTSRAGFCEHYAGAFVVLMRAMGIPARVVTGYQGGEINPVDGYLTVRQSDAHAWAEVWLEGRGWVRVDPTAAVAPERVEHNLAGALPPPSPFSLQGFDNFINAGGGEHTLLASLRFNWSALNNGWNQWVLDYNPERQRGVMQDLGALLGQRNVPAAGAAIAALLLLAYRLRRRLKPGADPLDELYRQFCRQQARRGLARAIDEGPQRYAARLAASGVTAERKAALLRFLAIYGAIKYGIAAADEKAAALKQLRRLLTAC